MGLKLFNSISILLLLFVSFSLQVQAQACKPSGKVKGKKPPPKKCITKNQSECCEDGKLYSVYDCSPPIRKRTKAVLTINSFERGGDGGGPSECDNNYHSDKTPVVALSTGWFNNMKRCFHNITIRANGRKVKAMVVDECDSRVGCDKAHDFQPPCPPNVVDASEAVWKGLGVPSSRGQLDVVWSE